jgi:enoyl-CoA hydratase
MDYETLLYDQDDHVVTLTYNRPDQHNAVNRTMNTELHHAWQSFRDDDAAFVLVITGAGDTTFCAGVDIFKPVIAAVNGYAFAAGLETAMLADIRIAAENAARRGEPSGFTPSGARRSGGGTSSAVTA